MYLEKMLASFGVILAGALVAVAGSEAVTQITLAAWSWRHSIEWYLRW